MNMETNNEIISVLQKISDTAKQIDAAATQELCTIKKPVQCFSARFTTLLTHQILLMEELLYHYTPHAPNTPSDDTEAFMEHHRYCDTGTVRFFIRMDLIMIQMPHLPPRTSRTNLAVESLASKLFQETDFPFWPRCSMDFYHVYPTNIGRMPRDIDNYAYKRTIDLLMFALRSSDCAAAFHDSRQTVFSDKYDAGTYIIIRPESSKNATLTKFETVADSFFP